jgi:hypothetical protein
VARVKSFVTGNNDKLVVAYHFPAQAKVGVNDFALSIYKMESGDFIPDAAYSVILRPEMPSMDHGSPNNVDPVYHDTEGMYAGKVNFTMTGEWRLNLTLEKADQSVPLFFDVTLN